jgi:acetolactate synthase regulatory subunit
MNHTMTLKIDRVEGAIIRTLGMIERRGFTVTGISTATGEAEHQMEMTVELHSAGRSVEVLARQVARLFDVSSVSLARQDAPAMRLEESLAC